MSGTSIKGFQYPAPVPVCYHIVSYDGIVSIMNASYHPLTNARSRWFPWYYARGQFLKSSLRCPSSNFQQGPCNRPGLSPPLHSYSNGRKCQGRKPHHGPCGKFKWMTRQPWMCEWIVVSRYTYSMHPVVLLCGTLSHPQQIILKQKLTHPSEKQCHGYQ